MKRWTREHVSKLHLLSLQFKATTSSIEVIVWKFFSCYKKTEGRKFFPKCEKNIRTRVKSFLNERSEPGIRIVCKILEFNWKLWCLWYYNLGCNFFSLACIILCKRNTACCLFWSKWHFYHTFLWHFYEKKMLSQFPKKNQAIIWIIQNYSKGVW